MIIGFGGKGMSGKSTAASYLAFEHGYHEFNFGDPIKAAAAVLIGEKVDLYYDHKTKAELISWLPITRRQLMQKLGTECVREHLGEDFWVKRLEHDIATVNAKNNVIGDVRFKNEAAMIHAQGGIVILLERDGGFESNHASEVIDFQYDVRIDNNGSLHSLYKDLNKLLLLI